MRHSDSDTPTRGWLAAYRALLGLTVAVGAVTFTLSFVGLRDYGIRVEQLDPWLAPLVPIGVDVLSLCGVAATYLLRQARARVRAYAWLVFGVAVALSVAGNLTHAVARHMSPAGMVGAAAWPILLALTSHLVIVTRRALERGEPRTVAATPDECLCGRYDCPECGGPLSGASVSPAVSQAAEVSVSDTDVPPVATSPARPASPQPRQRRPVARDNDITKQSARRRVHAGESCDKVATDLKVSKKTVERWTKDIREARQRGATAAPAGDSDDAKEREAVMFA